MQLGIGLGLTSRRMGFSPASLFALSEPGVWLDPSDLTTMFQDTAGTIPVTTPGQSVARINDKSGRGNNATQATAASRPTYGIVPLGGRRNLLTFSEQFDNSGWLKSSSTITANTIVAPDGTTTGDTATATTNDPWLEQSVSATAITYTLSVYLQGIGSSIGKRPRIRLIRDSLAQILLSPFLPALTSGWQRYTFTGTFSVNPTSVVARIDFVDDSPAIGDAVYFWGAQLETGSTATAYQRVGSQFDVTEAGVASLSYLSFDGVDDFLVTPTITPGIDKVQVFAGVRKLTDTPTGVIVEFSANININNGSFLLAQIAGSPSTWQFLSKGTLVGGSGGGASAAPETNVLTGLGDISGDVSRFRRNKALIFTSSEDQGTGNFLAYPIYIGRRGGLNTPFNGNIYSVITRFGANLTDAQITSTETWINSKTGAF
jgi:hypothetical protein